MFTHKIETTWPLITLCLYSLDFFLVSDRIWGQVMFHMNWYKIVNCKCQTKLRFTILIFVNIEIFTPWANGCIRYVLQTVEGVLQAQQRNSIQNYQYAISGYKTLMAQNWLRQWYTPVLQYSFVADFQMEPVLCETDPNSPDYTKRKNISAQRGASVYSWCFYKNKCKHLSLNSYPFHKKGKIGVKKVINQTIIITVSSQLGVIQS